MSDFLAINLFCGAGGSSLGNEWAGYTVIGYDNWPLAVETHMANGMHAHVRDLNVDPIKVRSEVDLVWASPPCQPFSNAREQLGQFDSRDGFPAYLKTLKKFMPRLTVFENVAGLTYKRHAAYLAFIIQKVRDLGYTVEMQVLDCSDYKIPQRRKRLVMVGRLDGVPQFPKKSKKKISVRQAIGDGSDTPVGNPVRYLKTPSFKQGYKGALLFNGRGRPIDLDEPSLTIYAAGGNHVHWFDMENQARPYYESLLAGGKIRTGQDVIGARRLTPPQMAILQGFPETFKFCGSPSAVVKQIGNAVPPRVARKIVEANA